MVIANQNAQPSRVSEFTVAQGLGSGNVDRGSPHTQAMVSWLLSRDQFVWRESSAFVVGEFFAWEHVVDTSSSGHRFRPEFQGKFAVF